MSRSILILEDSDADYESIIRALTPHLRDVNVYRTINGAQALERLRDPALPRPTVMLVDLNLPGEDGVEIITRVRAHRELGFVPIVVLSASTDPREIRACYDLGVQGYCLKSINRAEFNAHLRIVYEYWFECVQVSM